MAAPTITSDLLDLKLLPAWVKEGPAETDYSNFEGETLDSPSRDRNGRPSRNRNDGERRPPRPQRDDRRRDSRGSGPRRPEPREQTPRQAPPPLPRVEVRFLPEPRALENVSAQVKGGSVAYSIFSLARLFLEKPERYQVRLTGSEETPLLQLGENIAVSTDRSLLESRAFALMRDDFYKVDVTQSEPIKGNFSNVARDRLSGTLLGPTNHHAYQPQLRSLYEQRFSRRMSFGDYQKQIEIVSDPAVVEQWKEQARSVTTFTALREEPAVTFNSSTEAERHFRQTYLPELIRPLPETTIDGVASRALQDRGLGRLIEQAWVNETRSPSKMMQELAGALRGAALHIFRHRRGMLFVSPIRPRSFDHSPTGVSASVGAILNAVSAAPGISRKQLAEQLDAGAAHGAEIDPSATDKPRLVLASDLRWLVSEGHVIEFNDGSLDLPRTKAPAAPEPAKYGDAPRSEGEIAPAVTEAEVPAAPASETTES